MGAIYEEFERELNEWDRRYANNPAREITRLFLLALEREQIVSIAYSQEALRTRLHSLSIPGDVREIFESALIWAWKDEEMHAIYVRGALLRYQNVVLRTLAFSKQAAGALGGWAASVRQHLRWADAPLSSALAAAVTWAGYLTGKVPGNVRKHLDYGPFRDFCLYNADAERTAWLCFKRLGELVRQSPGVEPAVLEDIDRMRDDEERHRRVFEIFAAALDDADRLVDGETADSLTQKLGEIGDMFLPRRLRARGPGENPLGAGGRVFITTGETANDKLSTFKRLLDQLELRSIIQDRAAALDKSVDQLRIAIKPSFMLGYSHKDLSPITDPALVEALAKELRQIGCGDITIVEQRNIYDHFYSHRTVLDVARYLGYSSPLYRIVDVSEEQVSHSYARGLGEYSVSRTWKEADFRISFGKVRSHPVEIVYLSVANTEGLGTRCEEFIFAERQAHRYTANMMLLDQFPPHLSLLDAYDQVPDGLMGMMACPEPKSPMRFYAGQDALAVDLVAARHIGLKRIHDCGTLSEACHWFGDPSTRIEVVGLDEPIADWRSPYHNEWSSLLSLLAYPVYEYASDRGAVFVPEMDEIAFPPITPENPVLKLRRQSLQIFLGLRHLQ